MRLRNGTAALALAGLCAAHGAAFGTPVCHSGGAEVVIERPGPPAVFVLRPAAPGGADCDDSVRAGDRTIARHPHEQFLAVAGGRLMLDRGTGPDGRWLVARDIAGRAPDAEWPYSELVRADGEQLVVWRSDSAAPTPARCPELATWRANGLGAAIERQWRIEPATGRLQALDAWRCAPRQ